MKKIVFLSLLLFVYFTETSTAAEYMVDFTLVPDFEMIRPLIEKCADLGSIERYRYTLEATGDLEIQRNFFESVGVKNFRGCPDYISGRGFNK